MMNLESVIKKEKVGKKPKEKPKYNLWQNSAYMIQLAWNNQKSVLWLCLALALLAVGSNLIGLFIAPVILSKVETLAPLSELLLTIVVFTVLLMAIKGINGYISTNTLFRRIALRTGLLADIHDKLATTSYPNTEDDLVLKKLDKATMATSSNRQATEAIWNTFTGIIQNILGFALYLILLSSINPFVIVITLVTTVTGYFITKRIGEWGYRHQEEESEYSRRMNYISTKAEDHTLAKDIRLFGMRPWLEGIYSSTQRLLHAFVVRREKVYIQANIVDIVLSFLRNGVAYAYLITLTLNNNLSASTFLLYFSAVGGFTSWVNGILSGFSTLHKQSLDLSTLREFLETPEPFVFEEGLPLEPDRNKPYKIELKNVTFRYPRAEKDTLQNINLTIKPGEKLAIVGLNGAGKTTLVKLMCGFYDPTEGEVLLNGQNIKRYNRHDYYRHFSAVFQHFSLLEVTLAENIAQTDVDIDNEKVIACIEKAGLTSKIKNLPKGIDTHIGRQVFEDGIELSGGEYQRLMLARALYKDAPIIVLDEPTAALDSIAESDIYNKYNDLTGGRTSVYISHRLASTRFCDRIIYIDHGVIEEEGTHHSLIATGGKYAELFEIQSRYYKKGEDKNHEKSILKTTDLS